MMVRLEKLSDIISGCHRTISGITFIMIINFEQHLAESGFSRLRSIMLGDVPPVNQFAILMAKNPKAKLDYADEYYNMGVDHTCGGKYDADAMIANRNKRRRNQDLMWDLRIASFKPVAIRKGTKQELSDFDPSSIKGKFFEEDSFFVPHIDREMALYYGKQYEQEAVIWASKHKDENNNPYFKFEYIQVGSGDTHNTRIVSVAASDVQTRDDIFSQKGDRKIEFYIPFVDEVINGIMPLVEHLSRRPQHSFFSSDLPNTPEVQKLVKEILEHEKMLLNEKHHQKSKYHHRSIMGVRLGKLRNMLEGYKKNTSGI
jgi:hypothetical protein